MSRYAYKFCYDGTKPFHGLQRQPNIRTVETELIRALVRTRAVSSSPEKVGFCSASRTDRFASALGNVFAVNTCRNLPPCAINSKLSEDIRVWARAQVSDSFNPRQAAVRRHYKYFTYLVKETELDSLVHTSKLFVGMHDFRNFAHRPQRNSSIREIHDISIDRLSGNYICISVIGDSFLRRMVRKIVGTLIKTGLGSLELAQVEKLLDPKNLPPASGVPSAPAEGLVLWDVEYAFPFEIDTYAVTKLQENLTRSITQLVAKKAILNQLRKLVEKEPHSEQRIL